jgi:tripartite-type tricarboxylate transporter receptor subunit TctC
MLYATRNWDFVLDDDLFRGCADARRDRASRIRHLHLVGAPAGTPAQIIAKWNAEVARILGTPEMKAFFAQEGAQPAPTTPEAFAVLIKREIPKYAKIVKDSGAKVD